jgi:hypothetical protein
LGIFKNDPFFFFLVILLSRRHHFVGFLWYPVKESYNQEQREREHRHRERERERPTFFADSAAVHFCPQLTVILVSNRSSGPVQWAPELSNNSPKTPYHAYSLFCIVFYSRCMLLSCRIGETWSMPNGSSKLETFMLLFGWRFIEKHCDAFLAWWKCALTHFMLHEMSCFSLANYNDCSDGESWIASHFVQSIFSGS